MSVFVDADACPVKDEVLQVSREYGIRVVFVASYSHFSPSAIGHWIYVDSAKESADMYIVNHVAENDVAITDDYGLAGLLLPKRVYVLTSRGKSIHEGNITLHLNQRFLSQKARMAGQRSKGPTAIKQSDKAHFATALDTLLAKLASAADREAE
ncbi:YaiI/YqxD family protein [Aureibacillus halotolerans]|uniref:UPF0178 protein EV213_103311 n=1 Tax=Aureibacillus halotolerans TaxID=1508390 RepID=A0A4R6UAK8_9BACI|nr:DUF188 domain-containing protein [Aureibacillus halotolerans]TDQ41725.1 hypothetical protein EV213_103311 [Aureibacillus halotolerans]